LLRYVPEWLRDDGSWDASVKRLAPTTDIFDAPCRCIGFNGEWASFISGVLERYTHPGAWLGDTDDKQRGTEAIEKLLAAMGECDVVKNVRIYNGKLQIYISGEWVDTDDTGVLNIVTETPDLSGITEANRRCTVSKVFTDHARHIVETVTDSIDIGMTLLEIAMEFTALAGGWGVVLAVLLEAVEGAITFISNEANEWLDDEGWDVIQCKLHCSLDEENPLVDASTIATWITDIQALGPVYSVVGGLMDNFGGWDAVMQAVEYAEEVPVSECANCSACEPWYHEIDFTASNGDGYVHILNAGNAGNYQSNGWNASWVKDNSNNDGDRLYLYIPLPANATVTSVQVQDTVGTIYGKSLYAFLDPSTARCYYTDTPVYAANGNTADPLFTLGGVYCDTLVFWWLHTSNIDIRITSIGITGTGTNPYV